MQSQDDQWICPSFNSYSQNKSAETAVRVAENLHCIEEDEEDSFEFALILNKEFETTNQEMYSNFPVFNQDHPNYSLSEETSKLVPLRRLFNEEQARLSSSSSSSSEEDEMESIPPGSYCVWKPKMSHVTCKKSKSTGFGSKRWKLRDLLRRSNSEGKDSVIFLTPKKKEENPEKSNSKALVSRKKSLTIKPMNSPMVSVSASASPTRRLIYSPANRDIMRRNETPNGGMQKRKSYLPYRQDLVGFFTTVNSLGRNFSSLKMK